MSLQIETDSEWNPYAEHERIIESLRQALAEKDAKILQLQGNLEQAVKNFDSAWNTAAASQAREQQYQETLEDISDAFNNKFVYKNAHFECVQHVRKELAELWEDALSLKRDNSALESLIEKAGETMRDRCVYAADNPLWETEDVIRTIPSVSLKDLM